MKIRSIACAVLATASFSASAALQTWAPWDAAYTANGLAGVLFDVETFTPAGAAPLTTALGAHAYKNGAFLPNNGVDTFHAQSGTYAGPPAEADRANWSFDFGWDLGGCTDCTVWLGIDTDPSAGVNLQFGNITGYLPNPESWNMEMAFLQTALSYDFNPNGPSSTTFSLQIRGPSTNGATVANGAPVLVESQITVNVPEPGTLALAGLALAGIAGLRRRKA